MAGIITTKTPTVFHVDVILNSDLTKEEKDDWGEDPYGESHYIRVVHKGKTLYTESDCMEPEDATFYRDLSWIPSALEDAYDLGLKDGEGE